MAGVDLDGVAERRQLAERVEEILGALARSHREVGSRCVADEEGVSRQRDVVVDHECAVLGPMARGVDDADSHRSDLHHLPVVQRLERVLGLGERVDRHRHAVLERQASVARKVVGMGVRLQRPLDAHAGCPGSLQVLLDPKRRVNDDRESRFGVADQVRGAPEIVVHELPKEQHGSRG